MWLFIRAVSSILALVFLTLGLIHSMEKTAIDSSDYILYVMTFVIISNIGEKMVNGQNSQT